MLLINFYKKASVTSSVPNYGMVLGLFLFFKLKYQTLLITLFISLTSAYSQNLTNANETPGLSDMKIGWNSTLLQKSVLLDTEEQAGITDIDLALLSHIEDKQKQFFIQRTHFAEKKLTLQNNSYSLYGWIVIGLLICTLGYFFYNQNKIKNKQFQKESELKEALLKIESQRELQDQRLHISNDLHEHIGAQLTFIISSIDNLKYGFNIQDEKLNKKLESISDFTTSTIYELRDSIWAMNKTHITFDDLQSRISNYIEKTHVFDDNINFSFNVSKNVNLSRNFTSIEGINIHRIIKEAINNSVKHANATEIKVDVFHENKLLHFTITDDGKGFEMETVEKGNGILNMQESTHSINGKLIITSHKNKGSQIDLII